MIPPQIDDDWKKTNSHVAWWMGTVFTKGAICSFQIQYFCNETTITKRSRGKRETQRFLGKMDFMVVTFSSVLSPLVLWIVHLLRRGQNKVIRWHFCHESLKVVSKLETWIEKNLINTILTKKKPFEAKVQVLVQLHHNMHMQYATCNMQYAHAVCNMHKAFFWLQWSPTSTSILSIQNMTLVYQGWSERASGVVLTTYAVVTS